MFTQYLMTTRIPEFEYAVYGGALRYRWSNVVRGFAMPIRVELAPGRWVKLAPRALWQAMPLPRGAGPNVRVNENYYVTTLQIGAPPPCTLICQPR